MDTHDATNYDHRRLRIHLIFGGFVVGLASGMISVLYRFTLSKLDTLRNFFYMNVTPERVVLMLLLFFAMAVAMHFLLNWAPYSGGSGIPQIRGELLKKADIAPIPTLISKFFGGAMAALSGLTLGREGPSIQLGGTLAKILAKLFHVSEMEGRYFITAGASAGLSAAFNAPLAGALFSLEELHKSFSRFIVVPCVVASVTANWISFSLLGMEPAFSFPMKEMLPVRMIWIPVIIGLFGGLFGSLFNFGLLFANRHMKSLPIPRYLVIFLAMVLALLFGLYNPVLLGGGHGLIETLANTTVSGKLLIVYFACRMLLVWTGYGSGAQGGIFLPVLTLGALVGAFFHGLLLGGDMYYANFLYLGMAAILSSVVQAPFLSILLVSEMSGTMLQMISITTTAMIAYLIAHLFHSEPIYESLYEAMFRKNEAKAQGDYIMQYFLVPGNAHYIEIPLKDLNIPHHPVIASIEREDVTFTPDANTTLEGGDELLVLCEERHLESIAHFFGDAL